MAETTTPLTPRSPLDAVRVPGNYGTVGPDGPGVRLRERRNLALVAFMASSGDGDTLGKAAKSGLGLDLPPPNRMSLGDELSLLFAGQNRWYALAERSDGPVLCKRLADALGTKATLADQSHGQTVLELSGPDARAVLAKGVPIDLDPKVFAVGDVAATSMNHVHILLWRTGLDSYEIMVMRGFARDLWDFLTTMAGEFGYQIAF